MGLVDYSDSESDSETVQPPQPPQPAPVSAAPAKKPFQKLLDRSSGTAKIVVNLGPSSSADDDSATNEPPAKRVKTSGTSRFSNLGSFLPPPKKSGAAAPAASVKKETSAPAPGVHLRTGAAPAFVRDKDYGGGDDDDDEKSGVDGNAASAPSGPSIPEGQKPEEEVKLVGKPLMFKPLSVARKKAPIKNKKPGPAGTPSAPNGSAATPQAGTASPQPATTAAPEPPPPKKKISLFSAGDDDEQPSPASNSKPSVTSSVTDYDPYLSSAPQPTSTTYDYTYDQDETAVTSAYPTYQQQPQQPPQQAQQQQNDLAALTAGLSRAAQRELFGRAAAGNPAAAATNARVVRFDMEQEYAHNEALRASGVQAYNPVRAIAPGKHSLRQVVQVAQSNREALEESYARQRAAKGEAMGRYGWGK
ncbi:hypothetical protein VTJ04DRAFT_654 [Mycothermus thermophilus]|uniref:uncharacterized protein n=1 Tax=Humicola insolens TaxID=85995 RepID=UPI0037432EEA